MVPIQNDRWDQVSTILKYTDNVSEMLQGLGWPTLEVCRKEQRLILFIKLFVFRLTAFWLPLAVEHRFKFTHVRADCESFRHSFFQETISDWNSLQVDIDKLYF